VISVGDEGNGIPAEVIEHVFEPFFTTKAEHGGSGLGLATLYSIVHEAGGQVEVESEVGRGTRFHVLLPRFQSQVVTLSSSVLNS
jgi:signal transduction histidine kinase